jgi:branched-chain amino acid transport system ATP-binding protein
VAESKSENILEVKGIDLFYGSIQALHGISFSVKRGTVTAVLGANGAGKTSILRSISGLVKTKNGSITYKGENLLKLQPHEIVKRKIGHVPEGRGVFPNLTVEENLDLGFYSLNKKEEAENKDIMTYVFDLFPRLKERIKQMAGTLSGGEQQMLAMGRSLLAKPDLLLLDEPSLGLAPQMIEKIFEVVQAINKKGVSVLLVEQNAFQALQVAHRGIVIETGHLSLEGDAKVLIKSDEIRKSYLGVEI